MKIVRIETHALTMRMAEPYAISYAAVDRTTNVFVRLHTDTGLVGCGAAAPDLTVTGETPDSVTAAIQSIAEPLLKGQDARFPVARLESLATPMKMAPSAMAAVDMALWDLAAKDLDLPLWQMLGAFRPAFPISITLGVLPLAETLELAAAKLGQGFRILKIKGGVDVDDDIVRIQRLREQCGPGIEIIFDANQGYGVAEAVRFAKATKGCGVVFLEQPTPRDAPLDLTKVERDGGVPVMADEALMNLDDALHFAKHAPIAYFNIKLMKVGGIHQAKKVAAVAEACGAKVMVGCMDEAALSIAAGLHFALSSPIVRYADLDGHIGLEGDPTTEALILRDGILHPSDRPGLGFS